MGRTQPERPVLFINPASGGGTATRVGLGEKAQALGIRCVVLEPGGDLAALVREAIAGGADAVGMAGGDGSMATVAAAACDHGLPFVCVPAGTRNHFARDLGVTWNDPIGALAAFTDGVERRIDVGEVERPRLRQQRLDRDLRRRGAASRLPQREAAHAARDRRAGRGPERGRAAVAHRRRPRTRAQPPRRAAGVQQPLCAQAPAGRRHAPAARHRPPRRRLLGRPNEPPHRAGHAWTASRLDVGAGAAVHAGRDGEAITLDPPLHFASRPGALRVRIAARHARGRRRQPGRITQTV